jgi:glutamine synthetase
LPAVCKYSQQLASTVLSKRAVCPTLDCAYETDILTELSTLTSTAYTQVQALEKALLGTKKINGAAKLSVYYRDKVLPVMEKLRAAADALEGLVAADSWPIPTYGDLLFRI